MMTLVALPTETVNQVYRHLENFRTLFVVIFGLEVLQVGFMVVK